MTSCHNKYQTVINYNLKTLSYKCTVTTHKGKRGELEKCTINQPAKDESSREWSQRESESSYMKGYNVTLSTKKYITSTHVISRLNFFPLAA